MYIVAPVLALISSKNPLNTFYHGINVFAKKDFCSFLDF